MTRPTPGELETRAAPAVEIDGRKLRGVIPYDAESRDLGGWRERIARGALADADLSDLVATVDHAGVPLGRFPGTIEIENRDDGLHWSVDLPESRSDVREAVERGDLRASSWRMVVGRDRWDGRTRIVEAIKALRDVAVVTTPAYPAAVAELRGAPDDLPPDAAPTEAEEAAMPDTDTAAVETTGALTLEDRTADDTLGTVESRILDAMAAVPKGECRSLTHTTAAPVEPTDLQTFLWDALRARSVLLSTGVPVYTTTRKSLTWPVLTGDITADFYDELDAITPSDPTLDDFEIVPKAIKALVKGSSEAFDDSDPDLLGIVADNLATVLAAKFDAEGIVGNSTKGFKGLLTLTGTQTIASVGTLTNWDPFRKAVGLLAEAEVPGPYVTLMHPRVATALGLLKTGTNLNESLSMPDDLPPVYVTTRIPVTGGGTPVTQAAVFAPAQVAVARRMDSTIEVDRSAEFESDGVAVRGKLRAAIGTPHPTAVVKLSGIASPAIA